jgi:cytoskeletal protein CcmA (bactofilin family)
MFRRKGIASSGGSGRKEQTVIGATSDCRGSLKTDGDVLVYGVFEGDIQTAGTVVVNASAEVRATIKAQHASIAGLVVGNISATGRIEIATGASVTGDLECSSLLIDEGAVFIGNSGMRRESNGEQLLLAAGEASPVGEQPEGNEMAVSRRS